MVFNIYLFIFFIYFFFCSNDVSSCTIIGKEITSRWWKKQLLSRSEYIWQNNFIVYRYFVSVYLTQVARSANFAPFVLFWWQDQILQISMWPACFLNLTKVKPLAGYNLNRTSYPWPSPTYHVHVIWFKIV